MVLCVCYLPPENSSRQEDVLCFYDDLLADIYQYQSLGTVCIFGDLNSRCGDLKDYIEGVDVLNERDVIDFQVNKYGHFLVDFLINSNFCMLNGRQNSKNDFTSVSTKGASVVDYCFVSHSELHMFKDFRVYRASELVNLNSDISNFVPTSIPDHSCLTWNIHTGKCMSSYENEETFEQSENNIKFNVSTIPATFGTDPLYINEIHTRVWQLERSLCEQQDIDNAYADLCKIIKKEMLQKLEHKKILNNSNISNKRRRSAKPWWNDNLSMLWNDACIAEKQWLKCKDTGEKKQLRIVYISKRKEFDKTVQKAKRRYWYDMQTNLVKTSEENPQMFWKTIGKVGVAFDKRKQIPMEIVGHNGEIISDRHAVLDRWKTSFSNLYQGGSDDSVNNNLDLDQGTNISEFHDAISVLEIHRAIYKAKREKACGIDGIPSDVFRNDCSVSFLHVLFNTCFMTGVVPTEWGKGIINPIPKSNTSDPRDPLSYRGITLAPSTYKLYCSILNERLDKCFCRDNTLVDEQNGFRTGRSTIDHVSSLTNLIETRIKRKLSTYTAFIDFKKAYDSIDRKLLWQKLIRVGVKGRMLRAVKSLYSSVSVCVRINGFTTDWFDVNVGLRQGCPLSPLLFNCFINDLALKIKAVGKGVPIDDDDDELICIMLYADDVVLIAENERDLQTMLNELSAWCEANHMHVNNYKSKVVHYRHESIPRSFFNFSCCSSNIEIVDKYVYLGLTI